MHFFFVDYGEAIDEIARLTAEQQQALDHVEPQDAGTVVDPVDFLALVHHSHHGLIAGWQFFHQRGFFGEGVLTAGGSAGPASSFTFPFGRLLLSSLSFA